MKCCEKWKIGVWWKPQDPIALDENRLEAKIANYCPECGSKLESEWCKCPPKYKDCVGEKKVCYNCELPIKPKREYLEHTNYNKLPRILQPKRELPEKIKYFHDFDYLNSDWNTYMLHRTGTLAKKVDEILEYLK